MLTLPTSKFCKHCQIEHQLTKEYWYGNGLGTLTKCSIYMRDYCAKYRVDNRLKINAQSLAWSKRNAVKVKTSRRKTLNSKYKNNSAYALYRILSSGLYKAIKSKKNNRTMQYLGTTIDAFMEHIESLFEPGMTWDNKGVGESKWQVDHIIPKSWFDYSIESHIHAGQNWRNFAPMWSKDNIAKRNYFASPPSKEHLVYCVEECKIDYLIDEHGAKIHLLPLNQTKVS